MTEASLTLPKGVVVKGASEAPLSVGGFGDTPIAKLPLQASIVSAERMTDRGLISLAGLTSLDASVGDSYNSAGYVSYLKVRGFDLDNRFNLRRDGLPISGDVDLGAGCRHTLDADEDAHVSSSYVRRWGRTAALPTHARR